MVFMAAILAPTLAFVVAPRNALALIGHDYGKPAPYFGCSTSK
jgi:hypothetical protein